MPELSSVGRTEGLTLTLLPCRCHGCTHGLLSAGEPVVLNILLADGTTTSLQLYTRPRITTEQGRAALPLSNLPTGVYLLNVKGRTSKIVKP